MDDEYYSDDEYFVSEDQEYFDPAQESFYEEPGFYPDPLLIAAATCILCLFVFGLLTKLTAMVFGSLPPENLVTDSSARQPETATENNASTWDGDCQVSAQFPARITRWCGLITKYSNEHNLDPDLIAALIWLESGGNEQAYSQSGAVGLMQVMPRDGIAAGFACVNGPCFKDRPSTAELRDPEYNISFGTRFLAGLIRQNGNLREALKSYGPINAGYTYSDKVLSIFNRYKNN
jgi:soluble lytic murein transglycosylase-like protein